MPDETMFRKLSSCVGLFESDRYANKTLGYEHFLEQSNRRANMPILFLTLIPVNFTLSILGGILCSSERFLSI
jgi:hypothetical protein